MGPVGWLGLARRFLRAMEMWDLETWLVDVGGERGWGWIWRSLRSFPT